MNIYQGKTTQKMSTGQKNYLPHTESHKEHFCEIFFKLSAMDYY